MDSKFETSSSKKTYIIQDYGSIDIADIDSNDRHNLEKISNCTIEELINDKYPNLLCYPKKLNFYGDDIDEGVICSLSGDKLQARDLMGFVGINDTQLTIRSRFAKEDKEDYFLHYMVQQVFSINLFDLKHSTSKDNVFDFLVYLFPYHFKKAISQGLIRQYTVKQYNDAKLRGPIDVARHIRDNNPFIGNVAYHCREYSYDNPVTQLVRHTIEYIQSRGYSTILFGDNETKTAVNLIRNVTESYSSSNRQKIIKLNMRPKIHPYYTAYVPLQKLCVQILTHKGLKYGDKDDKIYGLLFSGSWLWEEYLSKILQKDGFRHPHNRIGEGSIYLFEKQEEGGKYRYKRYPDFFRKGCILDAKYKHIKNSVIDRDDLHQIISYMHVEESKVGGFIYPNDNSASVEVSALGKLRGYGGSVYKIGMPIPQKADSFSDFAACMNNNQMSLREKVNDKLLKELM